MVDASYQGKEFPPYTFEVDKSKIKELCLAIGDNNPIFFDKEYAQKEGYKDTPVSLTFPTVMSFWGNDKLWDSMIEMGVNIKKLLHAKEEYEYHQSIYPGDTITAILSVDKVRSGGAMDMITFKTLFSRDSEPVLTAKMTIVVPYTEGDE